jgi:hypothetical protein
MCSNRAHGVLHDGRWFESCRGHPLTRTDTAACENVQRIGHFRRHQLARLSQGVPTLTPMTKTIGEVDPAEVIGAVFGRDRLGHQGCTPV